MDFSTKFTVRTDMADEIFEKAKEKEGVYDDGITFQSTKNHGFSIDTINVTNKAAESLGKPCGKYVTVSTGEIWKSGKEDFENAALAISEVIGTMLEQNNKNTLCLIAGLGNKKITADAIGPLAADNIIVSRHIKIHDISLFESLELGECACIIPGVTGDTGAEAFELIKGAVDILKPSSVIVIDALASKNISRLAKTVQISDSGISPGSGVGNSRHEISKNTLGVPTVCIGVPTVVEALTLSLDLLSEVLGDENEVYDFIQKKMYGNNIKSFFVCPRETDKIIYTMAKLIGYSINLHLHKSMTFSEMDEFLR